MTDLDRLAILGAAIVGLLLVVGLGACTSPLDQATCQPGDDVGFGYACRNGFRVQVDATPQDTGMPDTTPQDTCAAPTEEEFCEARDMPCKKLTEMDSCGTVRTVDCKQFIDFNTSTEHCGSCGNACEAPNGTAVCNMGTCKVEQCKKDFRDLDGNPNNGCECEVTDEICDGKDNNCDGAVDENFPKLGQACDGSDDDKCKFGNFQCSDDGSEVTCGQETETNRKEICDGDDNDCDGMVDEGFKVGEACDGSDGDQCRQGTFKCSQDFSSVVCTGDGGTPTDEVCDGTDNDCDGMVDEGVKTKFWRDSDGDGKGDPNGLKMMCDGQHMGFVKNDDDSCDNDPDNWTKSGCMNCADNDKDGFYSGCDQYKVRYPGEDCDDSDDQKFPGKNELCDGKDNDCDGTVDDLTRSCGRNVGECSVGAQACNNGQWGSCSGREPEKETCDNKDNNCDGMVDNGVTRSCSTNIGVCSLGTQSCTKGTWGMCTGTVSSKEICDGKDNDCDGSTDEGCDDDGDGHCAPGMTYTQGFNDCNGQRNDCDDSDADVHPGHDELCDGKDNDCQGGIASERDDDGDGFVECEPWVGPGHLKGGDCKDSDPEINPGETEICDGKDNDCKGGIGGESDYDGDGYVECGSSDRNTWQGPGNIKSGDCDDVDALFHPDAPEICDRRDQDCVDEPAALDTWCSKTYPSLSTSCAYDAHTVDPSVSKITACCISKKTGKCIDKESSCANNVDDDGDGDTDCKDSDCAGLTCSRGKTCTSSGKCT